MRELFRRSNNERAGQEVDDFNQYKIRFMWTLPPNIALICRNVLTGNVFVKKGFYIIAPFLVRSKKVSLAENTIDYSKEKYKTIDDIEVTVDLAIAFSVSDPIKYEFNNNDPMQELRIKTQHLLRQYVASRTVDEMVKGNHPLSLFDSNKDYIDFERKSGIHVNDVYFKTIELPQSMKDDYEKKKVQEMENARLLAAAKNKMEVARIEAQARLDAARLDAEANKELGTSANIVRADEMRKILDEICNMDVSPTEKLELLKTQFISTSEGDKRFFIGMSDSAVKSYLLDSAEGELNSPKGRTTKSLSPKLVRTRKK